MGAIFLDVETNKGDKTVNAKSVKGLSATSRKVRAMAQKEAIENIYSMKIERSTNQRDQRRAKRK
jgi:hypothetical protein